jgi:hypothetical protein
VQRLAKTAAIDRPMIQVLVSSSFSDSSFSDLTSSILFFCFELFGVRATQLEF